MIQLDIPAAFVCAQLFAYSGRAWLAEAPPVDWTGRGSALSACYGMGAIGACGLYLYAGWTEWELMYWSRWVRMDAANYGNYWLALVVPLFLLTLGAAGLFGFAWAHRQIVAGRSKRVLAALWIGVALAVGMTLITPSAPMLIGRYDNYHAYIDEALASGAAWDYGIVAIGKWIWCVPWAAKAKLLAKHELITFFNPAFFVPWAIDMTVFMTSAYWVSRWFGRQGLPSAAP